jgi:hypothetical protein
MTTKVLVLYYSTYGHVEALAGAVSQGVRDVEGVKTELKRVPETIARVQGRHVARITRWLMQRKTMRGRSFQSSSSRNGRGTVHVTSLPNVIRTQQTIGDRRA